MYVLGAGVICAYGWYKLVLGIREAKYVFPFLFGPHRPELTPANSEYAREKTWSRIHLLPVLQAEEDRDQVRRYLADQKREKDLLGENIKVYNSDRFVRPTFAITPGNVTK